MKDYRKQYIAYRMAATAMTLNDLEGHLQIAGFFNAICRTFVRYSTRFQLMVCLHGSCALAELLVSHCSCFACVSFVSVVYCVYLVFRLFVVCMFAA